MLFASDFDGTLHFWGQPGPLVAQRDLDAIAAFRAAGGIFGVCTGRALQPLLTQTEGVIDFDFYITNSGATLFDGNKQLIWGKTLPREVVREASEYYAAQLGQDEFEIIVAADNYWVASEVETPFPLPRVSSFDEIEGPFTGFSIETMTVEAATAYAADLAVRYAGVLEGHQNLNSVDVVPVGCSKGTGLTHIADHFGATLTGGMGDSFNDLPLIMAADVGYTFNSAASDVRAAADVLVDHASEAIYDFMGRA